MSPSEEFTELKTLFYESSYSIEKIEIKHSSVEEPERWAKITLENNSKTKEIEGTSQDFVSAASQFKSVIQDGEEQFVDLSDAPVGGTGGYYQNLDHFIAKDRSSIEKGLDELQNEERDEVVEIDLDEALKASITGEMDNEELLKIVRGYHKSVALQWLMLKEYNESMEAYEENVPHDPDLFDEIRKESFAILRDEYINTNPMDGYRGFRDTTISDPGFLMEKISDIRYKTKEEWRALSGDGGKIESRIAMQRVLEDYSQHFEIARDLLRDLAATLDRENQFENVDLENIRSAVEFLNDNGYSRLTESILEDFRNAPSHMSLEIADEEGEVRIFDKRGRHRQLKETVGFQELLVKQEQIRDTVSALLIAFTSCQELLRYFYIKSNDFRFNVILNMDPELMDED